jgi:hypothetical protein
MLRFLSINNTWNNNKREKINDLLNINSLKIIIFIKNVNIIN